MPPLRNYMEIGRPPTVVEFTETTSFLHLSIGNEISCIHLVSVHCLVGLVVASVNVEHEAPGFDSWVGRSDIVFFLLGISSSSSESVRR